MQSIPEISARQEAYVLAAAEDPTSYIGLWYPEAHEPTKVAVKRSIGLHDMKGLIRIGLMEDVSTKYQKAIDQEFKQTGRTIRLFAITKVGFQMFGDTDERISN